MDRQQEFVLRTIDKCNGNKSEAMRRLKISRDRLYTILGRKKSA